MNQFLDARQMPCPQPIAKARLLLKSMPVNEVLTVWCKDEITFVDFKAFCAVAHHEIIAVEKAPDFIEIKIRKIL
ncbi:MAG: Sulfurtransferase TusA [Gammaproteobacteria bacterium]|jgi:TusA-related sulfurtransferase|nr:Sulfurtransferase TusA [Gammaproteobacteria bacterium]